MTSFQSLGPVSFLFSLFCSTFTFAHEMPFHGLPFIGSVASEATLEFSHWIEFPFEVKQPQDENGEILLKLAAKTVIEEQLNYLFGPMYAQKDKISAPKKDHVIESLVIEQKNRMPGVYRASYYYRGTLVTRKREEKTFKFLLPLPTQPDLIFKNSIVTENGQSKYPCFSEDAGPYDYSDKYFWYFWDPDLTGCPLVEGKDFNRAQGWVKINANTRNTYPQYPDLVKEGKISVSVFFGMDDASHSRNPNYSKDDAARSYKIYEAWLKSNRFKAIAHSKTEYLKYLKKNDTEFSLEEFLKKRTFTVKEYVKKESGIQLWVRLVFSPTGLVEDSHMFWHLFRDAIENHSLMIYDGHSGLGTDLSIHALNIHGDYLLKPDPKRYQIYHFDACDSYTYYNNKYFVLKGGTRYLDIISNGLLTDMNFDDLGGKEAGEKKKVALLQAVWDWVTQKRVWGYQEIAEVLDSGNLLGVNGDEDNPREPPPYPKN